ncbi:MAG: hypothetical protein V1698_02515 [bacterium]
MDKEVLLDNLRTNMSNNLLFNNGQEVVYFLINARKIIDNENLKTKYKTLYVYCNWIVHSKLDRESSTKFISSLLSPNLILGKSNKEILSNIKKYVNDIFNFEKLKVDIESFVKDKKIPVNPLLNWSSFCKHFLKEVNASEIEFYMNTPIKIVVECENSNRYKYAVFINKRIGSVVLKYK